MFNSERRRAAAGERHGADLPARHGGGDDDAGQQGPGRRARQRRLARPGDHARLPLRGVGLGTPRTWSRTPQTERLVYRRDLQTGTNVLISRASGADGAIPDSTGAFVPRMSADGNVVAFTSTRHEPVGRGHRRQQLQGRVRPRGEHEHDRARVPHVHGRRHQRPAGRRLLHVDLRRRALRRVRRRRGEPDRRRTRTPSRDVVVRDRVAGTTTLVSRATGAAGAPGDYSLAAPADLGRRHARRVRDRGRQPRLALEPGPGDALASPQRLRPRHGRRHHGAGQSRERGERGARQRRLRRPARPRDLRTTATKVVFHSLATNLGAPRAGRSASSRSCATSPRTSRRWWRAARRARSGR